MHEVVDSNEEYIHWLEVINHEKQFFLENVQYCCLFQSNSNNYICVGRDERIMSFRLLETRFNYIDISCLLESVVIEEEMILWNVVFPPPFGISKLPL